MSEVDPATPQNHVLIGTWEMNIQMGDEISPPMECILGFFFFYFIVFHFAWIPIASSSIL